MFEHTFSPLFSPFYSLFSLSFLFLSLLSKEIFFIIHLTALFIVREPRQYTLNLYFILVFKEFNILLKQKLNKLLIMIWITIPLRKHALLNNAKENNKQLVFLSINYDIVTLRIIEMSAIIKKCGSKRQQTQ